jgi:hypothetical protein
MRAQERYSLYPAQWHRRNSVMDAAIKFGSIRAVRSAASHFWIWDLLLTHPERLTLGFNDRPVVVEGCSPTDEVAYTFFMDAMKGRIGSIRNPRPLYYCTTFYGSIPILTNFIAPLRQLTAESTYVAPPYLK